MRKIPGKPILKCALLTICLFPILVLALSLHDSIIPSYSLNPSLISALLYGGLAFSVALCSSNNSNESEKNNDSNTEIQLLKAIIREKDDLLNSFVELAPTVSGFVETDNETVVRMTFNRMSRQYFGQTHSDRSYLTKNDLAGHEKIVYDWLFFFRKSESEKNPVRFESFLNKDNDKRILSVTVNFIGRFTDRKRYSYFISDVTENRIAVEALRESEEQFRSIADNLPIGMHVYSLDSEDRLILTAANTASDQILGITHKEHFGKPIDDIFSGIDETEDFKEVLEIAKNGGTWSKNDFEYYGENLNGIFDVIAFRTTSNYLVAIFSDVTERKISEVEIRESEEKYRGIFESVNDAILIITGSGKIIDCNSKALELFNYKRDEIDNLSVTELHKEHTEIPYSSLEAVIKEVCKGKPLTFECQCSRKSGESFYANVNMNSLQLNNETYILAVMRDITARKESESRVYSSEEKYRRIFENMQDVYFEADMSGRILEISQSISRISGYSRYEMIDKPLERYFSHPSLFSDFIEMLSNNGEIKDFEFGFIDKRKQLITCSINAALLGGSTYGEMIITGSMRDISLRKQAEENLKKEKDINYSLIQNSPTYFVALNDEFSISIMNKTMLEAMEYDLTEVIGENFPGKFVDESEKDVLITVFNSFERGSLLTLEYNTITKSGRKRLVQWHMSPIFDLDDNLDFILCVGIDITEAKLLEERLAFTEKMSAVGELSRKVAHEIGNPLASIWNAASNLHEFLDLEGDDKKLMEIILKESERLNTQIREFLKFSRMRKPETASRDIKPLIDDILIMLRNNDRFKSKKIDLLFESDEIIPDIEVDWDMLNEVFWNLLLNATDAIHEEGSISVRLGMPEEFEGRKVELRISDSGKGIQPENLEKVFEPYFTTKFSGSGLGLSIVKRIISDHSGDISVSSELGKGTEFIITLPVHQGSD